MTRGMNVNSSHKPVHIEVKMDPKAQMLMLL